MKCHSTKRVSLVWVFYVGHQSEDGRKSNKPDFNSDPAHSIGKETYARVHHSLSFLFSFVNVNQDISIFQFNTKNSYSSHQKCHTLYFYFTTVSIDGKFLYFYFSTVSIDGNFLKQDFLSFQQQLKLKLNQGATTLAKFLNFVLVNLSLRQ